MKAFKSLAFAAAALLCFASCDIYEFTPGPDPDAFQGVIETADHVDLGLSVEWAGCNIGAKKPSQAGDYYACGEDTVRVYYSVDDYIVDDVVVCRGYKAATSKFDPARTKLPEGYRMPTDKQVQELIDNCTIQYCTYERVPGFAVTGPNGKSIFFPCAGYKAKDKTVNNAGNPTYQATYWFTINGSLLYFKRDVPTTEGNADKLYIGSTANLYLGRPIRPIFVVDD